MERIREDVSLCDLPILKDEKKNRPPNDAVLDPHEEFAFGPPGLEMCSADEVFFRGRILPFRPSVSSDPINPIQPDPVRNFTRSESMDRASLTVFRSMSGAANLEMGSADEVLFQGRIRSFCPSFGSDLANPIQTDPVQNFTRSESMDRASLTGFSSRSSSSRSTTHREPTKSITRVTSEPSYRTRNQFHTHPSPKPHIRASSARLDRASSVKTKHKSSIWDFFRLGLVRTPDIELQEIRANFRSNTRFTAPVHGPVNSSNNSGSTSIKFFGGCKCSAETVASDAIIAKIPLLEENHRSTKINNNNINNNNNNNNCNYGYNYKKKKQSEGRRKKGDDVESHHRTYEWLKELSHANLAMHA